MSIGSIIGAGLGGLVVAVALIEALKLLLGCALAAAAAKTWMGRHQGGVRGPLQTALSGRP